MTTRRSFILGTFVLGCAAVLGVKPKRPGVVYFDGETDYLKTAPFDVQPTGFYVSAPDAGRLELKGDFEVVMIRCGDRMYFSHV